MVVIIKGMIWKKNKIHRLLISNEMLVTSIYINKSNCKKKSKNTQKFTFLTMTLKIFQFFF